MIRKRYAVIVRMFLNHDARFDNHSIAYFWTPKEADAAVGHFMRNHQFCGTVELMFYEAKYGITLGRSIGFYKRDARPAAQKENHV